MAKPEWGNLKPGRGSARTFEYTVSPVGEDAEQTPVYSPSRTVTGAKGQRPGPPSRSESARHDRRGG